MVREKYALFKIKEPICQISNFKTKRQSEPYILSFIGHFVPSSKLFLTPPEGFITKNDDRTLFTHGASSIPGVKV